MSEPPHTNCLKTVRSLFFAAGAIIAMGFGFVYFALANHDESLAGRIMFGVFGLPWIALGFYTLLRVPLRFCWDDTGFVNVGLFGRPGRRVAWSEVVALERSLPWLRARLSDGSVVPLDLNVVSDPQRYMDVLTTHLGHLIDAAVVAAEQRGEFLMGPPPGIRWQKGRIEWGSRTRRKSVAFDSLRDVERRIRGNQGTIAGLRYDFVTQDGATESLEFAGEGFLVMDLLVQRSIPRDLTMVDFVRQDPANGETDVDLLAAALRAEERQAKQLRRWGWRIVAGVVALGVIGWGNHGPARMSNPAFITKLGIIAAMFGVIYVSRVYGNRRKQRDLRQRLGKLGADPGPR